MKYLRNGPSPHENSLRSPIERIRGRLVALMDLEKILNHRTDLKIRPACIKMTPGKEEGLTPIQRYVLTRIRGVCLSDMTPEESDGLFRWLLCNSDTQKGMGAFVPTLPVWVSQIQNIWDRFRESGRFAELVLLEAIMVGLKRYGSPTIREVGMGDVLLDTTCKADWMMEVIGCTGIIQLGVQVTIDNCVKLKVADIVKHGCVSDWGGKYMVNREKYPFTHGLIRDTTIVASFPNFKAPPEVIRTSLEDIMRGSRSYTSRALKSSNHIPISHYSRAFEETIHLMMDIIRQFNLNYLCEKGPTVNRTRIKEVLIAPRTGRFGILSAFLQEFRGVRFLRIVYGTPDAPNEKEAFFKRFKTIVDIALPLDDRGKIEFLQTQ